MLLTWICPFLAGAIIWLINRVFSKRRPAPLPPGPRPLPLIGNMFDMPTTKPWLTFADWVKYGDISHIEILGKHIVVLNSVKEAQAMLDKKNSKYSDRPGFPMGGELAGCKYFLPLVGDGNRSRETRRQFHRSIGTHAAIRAYHDIEYLEVHKFLKRVYEHPERLAIHVRRVTGSIVLRISHGYQVQDDHDSFIELGENALLVFSKSTTQGAFLWFPGAGFKTMARKWKAEVLEMVNLPHQWVKEQMAAGVASKSFTSTLLDVPSLTEEDDHIIKWSAASFYGVMLIRSNFKLILYQTASAINAFFLAMTLFPEAQKKAQAEIDAVIGTDRLPSYTDRESLPFVQAIVKEVLRWHVVSPIIFPHLASEDDVHGGYCIPKGSIVLANAWYGIILTFMLHDPRVYSDPMEFRPERFLACGSKDPEPDPRTIAFGFGRRICPGLFISYFERTYQPPHIDVMVSGLLLANESLWLSAVASLAVFNISKVVENGVEITPEVDPSPHTISHPKPFECSIKPRSAKALELIQQDTY
ncbi:cytochrome P450 [Scleroderma citrinum]